MNERITEDMVRTHFKKDPLFEVIKFEEQRSTNTNIKKCLSKASKKLTKNAGYPEFLISIPALPNYLIVIECKANESNHESTSRDKPKNFAVDGVLHYSDFLSKYYNVISIAISGTDDVKVSSFYQKKGADSYTEEDKKLLDIFSYISKFKGESYAEKIESEEIAKLAIELNNQLNDYSVVEYERCTLISAILLALQDESFRQSYESKARTQKLEPKPDRLVGLIIESIKLVLEENNIDESRIKTMVGEYETIRNKPLAKETQIKRKKQSNYEKNFVIRDITRRLELKVLPLIRMEGKGYDVLGRFYTEFIRYAGTDKKTGLVLTPKHITEFFCDIVNLDKDDVVFDSCCGTGGFLVSAMKIMMEKAGNDEIKKKEIKNNQLIGVEKRTDMFTFACSNMMMRGDGKSHIYQADSFSPECREKVKKLAPTVAFLNPPYDVGESGQLGFINNALSYLDRGGRCVAIVQMSCAISSSKNAVQTREKILDNHTLKAVFSMPSDLFYPVGAVTCIMVFEAGNKHTEDFKSYFGYFKDDGFVKTKHIGRVDSGNWEELKLRYLESFRNRENIPGLSVTNKISANDEWCAEAYMETDYSTLTNEHFIDTIKNYIAFQFLNNDRSKVNRIKGPICPLNESFNHDRIRISDRPWNWFKYDEVFLIHKGFYNKKPNEDINGSIPFVGASENNNGITSWHSLESIENSTKTGDGPNHNIDKKIFKGNKFLTVSNDGSTGYAFFQPINFTCSHSVNPITTKNIKMNPYIAMFLSTLIKLEKYRWDYGRKWRPLRMPQSLIKLPIKGNGLPDWQFMEDYIKSLPYSFNI